MRHQLPLKYIDVIARVGSIRKAAEKLAITSTALNRRVLAFEEDLGSPIFERLPKGVRLSAAGEVLLQHIRTQLSDMDRVKNQIADLGEGRRGHVRIVSGQAAMLRFLPEMISSYRQRYPQVTFDVRICNRHAAEKELAEFTADLAIVFEPDRFNEFHSLVDVPQEIFLLCSNNHPLADNEKVRLRDCAVYPMALPTTTNGVRYLLDRSSIRTSTPIVASVESDNHDFLGQCVAENNLISFQIGLGVPDAKRSSIVGIPVDLRDLPAGRLYVGQLRRRTLPVAAAQFSELLVDTLRDRYDSSAD